jgi:hypothetical protein
MPLKPRSPSAVVGDEDEDDDDDEEEEIKEYDDDVHPASTTPAAITATSRKDGERGRDRLIAIFTEFLCISSLSATYLPSGPRCT